MAVGLVLYEVSKISKTQEKHLSPSTLNIFVSVHLSLSASVKTLHFHALLRDPVCVYASPCCKDVLNSMLIELKQN